MFEKMTLGQLANMLDMLRGVSSPAAVQCCSYDGYRIVVLDRQFVYVGDVAVHDDICVIREPRNIRKWGTTKGLGQLAISGPQSETVLDEVTTVYAPMRAVIHMLETDKMLWSVS